MKTLHLTIKVSTGVFLTATLLAMSVLMSISALASPAAQIDDHDEHMRHLKELAGKDFEIEFVSMMIPHHQEAIEMAELVPDRSNHEEIKTLARNIIAAQSSEITQMTGWLKQWYDVAPKEMMHEGMMHEGMMHEGMQRLETLRGDEFDKAFLSLMIMHHQGALEMSELIPARATHDELKMLGESIIASQTAEIRDMENWLKSWYNLDATGAMPGGSMDPGHMPMPGGGMMDDDDMMGADQPGMPRTGSPANEGAFAAALVLAFAFLSMVGIWLRKRAY